jgi:NDP-sugar pyrophosphorylase family protein
MQVVILSGGLGTRLKALDFNGPKALVPVRGHPFVWHQLRLLAQQGFREVLMCIGHLGEQIEAFVGDVSAFGMNVQYAREDPAQLLGTGGALVKAAQKLADEFLLIYGDSYLPTDFRAMVEWSLCSKAPAVMSVFRNAGRWDKSNARVHGDRVSFYSKKAELGECDYIDYGLSYFKKEVFEAYTLHSLPLDLAAVQQDLCAEGRLGAFEVKERFYEVGTPEGIAQLEAYFAEAGSNL